MGATLFLDIAPSLTGYCVGDGLTVPEASAWRFPDCGDDLGALGEAMDEQAEHLIRTHGVTRCGYETPILRQHDKLMPLRRIYGLGMQFERTCKRLGVPCGELDLRRIKSTMAGDPFADKKLVVQGVLKLGIALPKTDDEGRKDAADAAGGWLITLSEFDPTAAAPWLARLKGTLL